MKENVRNTVIEVLREYPKARDSDIWLIIEVLRKLGVNIFIDYSQIPDMPSLETITRHRRDLQNTQGLYLPSEEVDEARKQNEIKFRREFNKPYPYRY